MDSRAQALGVWGISSGCLWKEGQLGGWLPGGWGTAEGAGARILHLDGWPWERGVKGQGGAAGEGELLLGGAECGRRCCHHQPRPPFWLTQVLPAGLDALGQVPASPPSPRAAPAHRVGAELPPSICIRRLAMTCQAEGSLASQPCPALPTRRSEPPLGTPDGPAAALHVAPLGQVWGWLGTSTYVGRLL